MVRRENEMSGRLQLWREITTQNSYIRYLWSEKSVFYEIVEGKYGKAGLSTDENITQRLRIECWVTTETKTH
jgi:hypothetical protein